MWFRISALAANMKGLRLMEKDMGKENFIIKMEECTMVNGKITKCKVMGDYFISLEKSLMKDFGMKISLMEEEFFIMKSM